MHGLERLVGHGDARALTGAEIRLLRPVFADAIDYSRVTVRTGGAKGRFGLRAHVVCDDIWLSGDCVGPDGALSAHGRHVLLHEAVHVWQHQRTGTRYIAEALAAQLLEGARGVGSGEAYDWLAAAARGTRFAAMNPEAQAELGCWIGHAIGADGEIDRDALERLVACAPGAPPRTLSDEVFAVARGAHDALRAAPPR